MRLAYLHVVQNRNETLLKCLCYKWPTAVLVNRPDRLRENIASDIERGLADVATVGRFALANPDLVERLKTGAPLNVPDPSTFYGGGECGYTDYPVLSSALHASST